MATEPDENRDEDFDIEDDAAEGEDESSSEAEEGAEGDEAASEEGADEGEEEGEEEAEGEEEGEDDPDYDPKLDPSGKFKGKSKKEIMQSYRNLETSIGDKAQKMAQDILKKKGIAAKPTAEDADGEDDFDLGLTEEEISKMKPGEFGKHISRKILEKATEIARNTIDRTNEVRGNVSREIREATEAHPHLKENPEYRDIVISLIEAAAGRGEVLSLKDACKKADKAAGIKPKDPVEKIDPATGKPIVKKNRMSVERAGGSGDGKQKTEGDRIREGLMAGSSTGNLGGMGV